MELQDHSEINNLLKILEDKAEKNKPCSLSPVEIRNILKLIKSLKGE